MKKNTFLVFQTKTNLTVDFYQNPDVHQALKGVSSVNRVLPYRWIIRLFLIFILMQVIQADSLAQFSDKTSQSKQDSLPPGWFLYAPPVTSRVKANAEVRPVQKMSDALSITNLPVSGMSRVDQVTIPALPTRQNSNALIRSPVVLNGQSCINSSQSTALRNDTIDFTSRATIVTRDNNVIVLGDVIMYSNPQRFLGNITKCDPAGKVIWMNVIDSVGANWRSVTYYYNALELADGSIIAIGIATKKNTVDQDILVTKIDPSGTVLWHRFYRSRLWTTDGTVRHYFAVARHIMQDPASGDVFVAEDFYNQGRGVVRLDEKNGDVIWARSYQTPDGVTDRSYGLHIFNNQVLSFGQHYDSNGKQYLSAFRLDITNGNLLERKDFFQSGLLFNIYPQALPGLVELDNGNLGMTGQSSLGDGRWFPQGFVMEFTKTLQFVRAYAFSTQKVPNFHYSTLSLYRDGSGIMVQHNNEISGVTDTRYTQFTNAKILKQRTKYDYNQIMPVPGAPVRLADGSDLMVRLMYDNNELRSRTEFIKMFVSDAASDCLGVDGPEIRVDNYQLTERAAPEVTINDNVIETKASRTFTSYTKPVYNTDECAIPSGCDSVRILVSDTVMCINNTLLVRTQKNAGCGTSVPLRFDSSAVSVIMQPDDSTHMITFNASWSGYLSVGIDSCAALKDSIFVRVLDAPGKPSLGADRSVCAGNTIILHAGKNYAKYLWQDGSTDSLLAVSRPGLYHVEALDACGNILRDTVLIDRILELPAGFLPADTSLCSYGTMLLRSTGNFSTYAWSNGATGPSIGINTTGKYWLEVKHANGCVGRDTISVVGKECFQGLHVPNVFSPNRDGKNDVFKALLFGNVQKFELSIFNRWGGRIFLSTDRFRGWDGTVGPKPADTGLYIWSCRYQLTGEQEIISSGQVNLVR